MKTVKTIVAIAITAASFNASAAQATADFTRTVSEECSITVQSDGKLLTSDDTVASGDRAEVTLESNNGGAAITISAEIDTGNAGGDEQNEMTLYTDATGSTSLSDASYPVSWDDAADWGARSFSIAKADRNFHAELVTSKDLNNASITYAQQVTFTVTCF